MVSRWTNPHRPVSELSPRTSVIASEYPEDSTQRLLWDQQIDSSKLAVSCRTQHIYAGV